MSPGVTWNTSARRKTHLNSILNKERLKVLQEYECMCGGDLLLEKRMEREDNLV